LVIPL